MLELRSGRMFLRLGFKTITVVGILKANLKGPSTQAVANLGPNGFLIL